MASWSPWIRKGNLPFRFSKATCCGPFPVYFCEPVVLRALTGSQCPSHASHFRSDSPPARGKTRFRCAFPVAPEFTTQPHRPSSRMTRCSPFSSIPASAHAGQPRSGRPVCGHSPAWRDRPNTPQPCAGQPVFLENRMGFRLYSSAAPFFEFPSRDQDCVQAVVRNFSFPPEVVR